MQRGHFSCTYKIARPSSGMLSSFFAIRTDDAVFRLSHSRGHFVTSIADV